MLMQVHDELVFEVREDRIEAVSAGIRERMAARCGACGAARRRCRRRRELGRGALSLLRRERFVKNVGKRFRDVKIAFFSTEPSVNNDSKSFPYAGELSAIPPVLITGRTQRRPGSLTSLSAPREIGPSPDRFSTGPESSPWLSGLFFLWLRKSVCRGNLTSLHTAVIPAEAGIHWLGSAEIKMDPGFRRDDEDV